MFRIRITHNYDFRTSYDFISTDNITACRDKSLI